MRAAIITMGSPKSAPQLFGERRSRGMSELSAWAGSEGYGACDDADAPSKVTQAQLDELHIAITAEEEE